MLRDGSEIKATVNLISNDDVSYQTSKKEPSRNISTKDVYMVKFDSRGNIYIDENGYRITGENQKLPRLVDIVYLVDYQELPAYNLKITSTNVSFSTHKPSKKVIPILDAVYPRDKVFKIKYKDGTMDIITSLDKKRAEPIVQEKSAKEEPQSEPQYQVIFHTVGKKETIKNVADKYEVPAQDLMQWNEIPTDTPENSLLTPNQQLMIYLYKNNLQ